MAQLGLEAGLETLRAVRVGGLRRRVQALEIAWDPEAPDEAARELRERLGTAARVSLAVETSALFVKRVLLPPVPAAEKRRMLALEPERYFPVRAEDLVVAVREDDDLVFGLRQPLVERWVDAFQTLGPVERIEPAPVALARALARGAVRAGVLLRALGAAHGVELTDLRGGRVHQVRRLFGDLASAARELADANGDPSHVHLEPWDDADVRPLRAALPRAAIEPLPSVDGVPAAYLAAYGATLGPREAAAASLAPPTVERHLAGRRRRRLLMAVAACVLAGGFLIGSLDRSRERALHRLDAETAALGERAAPLVELQREAAALTQEARALRDIERGRIDPLPVLLALSDLLPRDAHVRSLRGTGSDWQVNGYARDAARLIPQFEADARFADVRFLTATTRVQRGDETYEDFSLALRYVPSP